MGDRTTVVLTVLQSQLDEVKQIVDPLDGGPSDENMYHYQGHDLVDLMYYEVNYGNLHSKMELLHAGIPNDQRWDKGSEYSEGTETTRFTEEGLAEVKIVYDNELSPSMESLLEVIDDPVKLRQLILDHKESTESLSWDNQVEYGKRHRTLMLITSKE